MFMFSIRYILMQVASVHYLFSSDLVTASWIRSKVIKASLGKQHTVVVTADGQSFGFGFNKHGQLGAGFCKEGELIWPSYFVISALFFLLLFNDGFESLRCHTTPSPMVFEDASCLCPWIEIPSIYIGISTDLSSALLT